VNVAQRALGKYLERPDERTEASLGRRVSHNGERPLPSAWFVGQAAVRTGNAPHVLFGLNAMHQALVEHDDPSRYRELIALTGAYDIFDVLSKAPGSASAPQAHPTKSA
jgi:hypothetical protein